MLAELPALLQTGVAIVKCKGPLAVEAHPLGALELRLWEFGARDFGRADGAGHQDRGKQRQSTFIRQHCVSFYSLRPFVMAPCIGPLIAYRECRLDLAVWISRYWVLR